MISAQNELKTLNGTERSNALIEISDFLTINKRWPEIQALSEELLKNKNNRFDTGLSQYLTASLLLERADFIGAMRLAETARSHAEASIDKQLEPRILRFIGNLFLSKSDYAKSLEYYNEALSSYGNDTTSNELSKILNSIAIAYWRMSQWSEAEHYLRLALSSLPNDPYMRLVLENNLAVALLEQDQLKEAETLLLIVFSKSKNSSKSETLGLSSSNLGDLYQRKGDYEKAKSFLETAIREGTESKSEFVLARSNRHLANIYIQEENWDLAMESIDTSIVHAKRINESAEVIASIKSLIRILEQSEQFAEALTQERILNSMESKIIADQVRFQTTHFNIQNELAEKEKQLIDLEKQELQKQFQFRLLIGLLLIVAILSIGLYSRYRYKKSTSKTFRFHKKEIADTQVKLKRSNSELESLFSEKREFFKVVDENLKSLLQSTKDYADSLADEWEETKDSERVEAINEIQQLIDNMMQVIGTLMDQNKIEQGMIQPQFSFVDPIDSIKHATKLHKSEIFRKNLSVIYQFPEASALLQADTILLQKAFENLLSNAVKFSPNGSKIEVSIVIDEVSSLTRITVKDEGQGIPSAEMPFLFQKFSDLTPKPTGGELSVGLGLFITKKLIEMMNGKIHCKSIEGKGTSFIIEFPSAEPSSLHS